MIKTAAWGLPKYKKVSWNKNQGDKTCDFVCVRGHKIEWVNLLTQSVKLRTGSLKKKKKEKKKKCKRQKSTNAKALDAIFS